MSPEGARQWHNHRSENTFPEAELLIGEMNLVKRYKDVTFETLNEEYFLKAVKTAFPIVDWDKAYEEWFCPNPVDA